MKFVPLEQESFDVELACYSRRVHQIDVAKILELSVEERLRLIDLIWESLSVNPDELPLREAHRKMLEERLAEHERDPDDVITHEELMTFVRSKTQDHQRTQRRVP